MPLRPVLYLFFSLMVSFASAQQPVLYSETFDYNGGALPPGWTTNSIFDAGPGPAPGQAFWKSVADGTAKGGAYWEGRFPIISPTGLSGAVVFDSDSLDSNGIPGSLCGGPSCGPHAGELVSPPYDLSTVSSVGLEFYQYLRSGEAQTFVGISNDGGQTWNDLPVNQLINDRPFGGESDPFSLVRLDISPWAANQPQVQIRFLFEGSYYFWLIDDMALLNNGGPDLAIERLDWPGPRYACLLDTAENFRIRITNLGSTPQGNFPLTYRLDGGPPIMEMYPGVLDVNQSDTFTFTTPANLYPDLLGHFVQFELALASDANPGNNQIFVEYPPCELRFDSLGAEYIGNHLIVQFAGGVSNADKDSVRQKFNAKVLESCACDSLELWDVELPVFLGPDTLLGVEEVRNQVKDEAEVEESDLDYLLKRKVPPAQPANFGWAQGSGPKNDSVVVAVIDTGLDFFHDSLSQKNWNNALELSNPFSPDDDTNCYRYDHWGHHFLEPEQIPEDDHSHGTHVSGLILKNLPDSVKASIMPLKVQAENGKGSLFHTLCAMYYAAAEGADIVNMSLGFYGERPAVMDTAFARIGRVHDLLFVTSAGNQGYLLDTIPHWPSGFSEDYPQVLSVTALNKSDDLAPFSNYGPKVDLAAPGVDQWSTVPGGGFAVKNGTSMAAAVVTRAAVLYQTCNPGASGSDTKTALLNLAKIESGLAGLVKDGKRLNLADSVYLNCSTIPIEEEIGPFSVAAFPNPASQSFQLQLNLAHGLNIHWVVLDIHGKVLVRENQRMTGGQQEIDMDCANWAPGVYFWEVRAEDFRRSGKLIKN
jgi:hypothetical protein